MARRSRKGAIHVEDLSGVETGRKAIPEGEYIIKVAEVEQKQSSNKNPMLAFTFEVAEGTYKGSKLFHNCSLQSQALFNLKGLLLALGYEIPKGEFDLDTSDITGLTCGAEVSHEVYNGKKRARITDFYNPDEEDGEDEEIDLSELDTDELKELAKAVGITAKALKKLKTDEDLIEAIEEEDYEEAYEELFGEDEEEEDDEEEDEEEDDEESDYEEMSLKELKAEAKERGLKIKKGMDKDAIVEMLEEDDEE